MTLSGVEAAFAPTNRNRNSPKRCGRHMVGIPVRPFRVPTEIQSDVIFSSTCGLRPVALTTKSNSSRTSLLPMIVP
jgi:hypothetical protein